MLAGIFVGGHSRRLGGIAKGLLAHPSEAGSVIEHVLREAMKLCNEAVLVGSHAAYANLGLESIDDAVAEIGPAGGLLALLRRANGGVVLALACDMPAVKSSLLGELVQEMRSGASAAAFSRDGRLEPLCATYRVDDVLPHVEACVSRGVFGLHRILRSAGVVEVALTGERARLLDDWDTPEDLRCV